MVTLKNHYNGKGWGWCSPSLLEARPIGGIDRIRQLADLESEIFAEYDNEIPSRLIGEMVMERLSGT